jgi:hypothetical protein
VKKGVGCGVMERRNGKGGRGASKMDYMKKVRQEKKRMCERDGK